MLGIQVLHVRYYQPKYHGGHQKLQYEIEQCQIDRIRVRAWSLIGLLGF